MKRLILTLEYPPKKGGISTYVYNFAKHLPAEEVVVCAPPPEIAEKESSDSDNTSSFKVVRRKPYWLLIWPHWIRWVFSVAKIIKQEKIEILHVHHVLPVGYIAFLFKKIFKIPYVVFFHGTDLRIILKNKQKIKKVNLILNSASGIVVNSNFLLDKLSKNFSLKIKPEVIYPCPSDNFLEDVDIEKVAKLKSSLGLNGKKIMLSVGRISSEKGHEELLKSIPQLLQTFPNLVWLIVGEGDKKDALISEVQKKGLQSVVRFLGEKSIQDLPCYYALSDIFVLLTHTTEKNEESFGTVFLEASASRLPMVAGRCGGVPEAVIDGATGYLVDYSDQQKVIEFITHILSNQSVALEMGKKGKEFVQENFTWDKQLQKIKI